ncbi:glycoside hydrolase family 3 N-terminal domain-containing protein [Arenicella sp. 4NH20-0111]|uniref:glycoside hydrolase family 3 protein n=1 Tax=Arenicella sp. 4NH20-0111 TaxID=3127648 RepID=UPI00333F05D3
MISMFSPSKEGLGRKSLLTSNAFIQGSVLGNRHLKSALIAGFLVSTLGACTSSSVNESTQADNASSDKVATEETGYQPHLWPKRDTSPPRNDDVERRAKQVLAQMSVEEKVGQIMQPELKYVTAEDIRKYHIGSVLNGGGTSPNNNKFATVEDWANLAQQFYTASMDTSDGKVAIPLIWGSDAVHGNNNVYGATLFPHNIGLGAAGDPELMFRVGRATAMEVVATGVDWTFGPTVAVVRDVRWGRTYESYSEDPKIVREYASEMVRGIQGADSTPGYKPKNVVATAKHFLGDGGTTQGVDRGDTAVSEKELVDVHAAGYISALDGNVLTTMASFNSWNGNKLHGHKYLMTDILKSRMGFDGLVVSDWNGHMQVPGCSVKQCAAAINAGLDLVMVPSDWKAMLENTINAVNSGEIPMARLDDAVTRVLRVKLRAGLFDVGPVLNRPHVGDVSLMGHKDHRAVAREAVRKSLVMLKNNGSVLPLSSKSNILVAGDGAHNIGKQAGGWTLSWQGTGNKNEDFPGASSIWDGIRDQVESAGGKAVLKEDGAWSKQDFDGKAPDVAVVVYGEEPYAEWHGDITNIEYQYGRKSDIKLLKKLKDQNIPVVSVFITGRPLWVNKELNASDAFVVAWLPGSEGAGVAEVLLKSEDNSIQYDFQGKLSFSWPKSVSQSVLNVGQEGYDPLFPYGYGLTYGDSALIANNLDESTARMTAGSLEESWMFVSREMSEYQFRLIEEGAEPVLVDGNRKVSADDENLLLMSVDKVAQEDARRMSWKGLRPATVSLAAKYPLDFSEYLRQSSVLSFSMRVDKAPKGNVSLSMVCAQDCDKSVDFTASLKAASVGEYVDYKFDLGCFVNDEATLKALTQAFVISSDDELDVVVSDIKVMPNVAKGLKNDCGHAVALN